MRVSRPDGAPSRSEGGGRLLASLSLVCGVQWGPPPLWARLPPGPGGLGLLASGLWPHWGSAPEETYSTTLPSLLVKNPAHPRGLSPPHCRHPRWTPPPRSPAACAMWVRSQGPTVLTHGACSADTGGMNERAQEGTESEPTLGREGHEEAGR